MTVCRSVEDVQAAADEDSHDDPPLSQETADLVGALLAPHRKEAAQVA